MIEKLEPDPGPASSKPGAVSSEQAAQFELARQLLAEQNLLAGILAGLTAAATGVIAWVAVSLATEAMISMLVIGLGVLTGYGVRVFGRGVTDIFCYVAAVMAVLGCAAGNVAAVIFFHAQSEGGSLDEALGLLEFGRIFAYFVNTLSIADLIYWVVAAFSAWWFAKRSLTGEEAQALYVYELQRPSD